MLRGKFKVLIGAGGNGSDGGPTALYQEIKDNNTTKWVLVASVRGGLANTDASSGEATYGDNECGMGGNDTNAGTKGEVIIKW